MKKIQIFLFALVITSGQTSYAATPKPSVSPTRKAVPTPIPIPVIPKAACRIEVDNAHFSTYSAEYKKSMRVKIVARSICNVIQSRVQLTLRIYKVGFFTDHLLETFETDPSSPKSSGFKVAINNAEIECRNKKSTRYYGIASSTAFINGVEQIARNVRSTKTVPLACGT